MSLEDHMSMCEHAVRVCRSTAEAVAKVDAGLESEAALLKSTARALERSLRNIRAAPAPGDESDVHYLDELLRHIETPYHWVTPVLQKWTVRMLRRGHHIVREMLGPLEIYGSDIEIIGDAQHWLADAEHGPDISAHGTSEIETKK